MKSKIFSLLLIVVTFKMNGQIINAEGNCFWNESMVFTIAGNDGGTPLRNIYTATITSPYTPCKVYWSVPTSQWTIAQDQNNDGTYEYLHSISGVASAPNPSDLASGFWLDIGGCGSLTMFTGSGTLPPPLTINAGGNCFWNESMVFTLAGDDGGTPLRNVYTATITSPYTPCKIYWSTVQNSWVICQDQNNDGIYEYPHSTSVVASAPNPPDLASGSWLDIGGCGALSMLSGTGTQQLVTSINDFVLDDIKVFMNPSMDNLIVKISEIENCNYTITDILGKCYEMNNLPSNKIVSLTDLPSGTYFFQIKTRHQVYTKKIIK